MQKPFLLLGFCVSVVLITSVNIYVNKVLRCSNTLDKAILKKDWFGNSDGHVQPYGVIGILSKDKSIEKRDIHRKIFSMRKQSNVTVLIRFLLDRPTEETLKELQLHSDIIFLNSSYSGYAVQFAEKLHKWFIITTKLFPDAKFVGKMDDDVYICDTSFKVIWKHWSSLMYLGWAHNFGWKNVSEQNRLDEMFVVTGSELVQRITNRKYCNDGSNCHLSRKLYPGNYAGSSLGLWLSIYNDVKSFQLNQIIIHSGKAKYVKGMCEKYFLIHKIKSNEKLNEMYYDQHF